MNQDTKNICPTDGEVLLDANAVCDVCGKFGAYDFGHQILCQDCYGNSGSCCREFGSDDLWATPNESKTDL